MSDRITEIRRLASDLLKQSSSSNERVQIRVDEKSLLPIFLARSFPSGSFTAVIHSVSKSDMPPNYRRPEIKGLDIHWLDLESKAGSSIDIAMELIQDNSADIFFVFIARLCEVAECCDTPREALRNALAQIHLWKEFFSGAGGAELSDKRQTGLYGELTILCELVDSGIEAAAALNAWTGSSATNQDFEFGKAAIEVKSTTSADASNVMISNIRQLDPTGLDALCLSRLAFDVRQGDTATLVGLVSKLRELISTKAAHLQASFEEKLLKAGYRLEHEDQYRSRSYAMRHHHLYKVEDGFPRIEEKDLVPGISNVKYEVSLHGCDQYKIEFSTFIERILATSG